MTEARERLARIHSWRISIRLCKCPERSAIVDPFKVRNYLLANDHDVGRHKAKFFESLGYHRTRWGELARALYEYAQQTDAVPADTTAFGTKYIVASPMTGPSGRSAVILSVWIVRRTETFPRLVTAYKGEIR
jgi:hypothetical protein